MNKTLFTGILSASLALALTGCSAEEASFSGGSGRIFPEVGLDTELITSARSARADGEISAEDLTLTLSSADGSYSNSWNGTSAFPTDEPFKTGAYTMSASYGSPENEGFDKPYYFGSTDLKVNENETTHVSITAQLANSMVSVEYSDNFKSYMTDWNAELHASGGEYIYYAKDESRPAYLISGATTLNVTFTKPNGQSASLQAASFVSEPRHHYHITVDLKQGAGDAVLVVSFDDSLALEDIEIELSDELMNAPAPTTTAVGFTPGSSLSFVAGMVHDLAPKFNLMARGNLASVILTTKSKSLVNQGWPEEVDLIAIPENIKSRMTALGFDCLGLWKNPDKMAVIDFSKVLPFITYLESGANDNSFTVVVRDRFNKVSEPMTLDVNVLKLELALSNPETLYIDGDELRLTLSYNGFDPEKNVRFQYMNNRGTWTELKIRSITSADNQTLYKAVLTVPANENDLTIRAVCGSSLSETLDVKRAEPPFALICDSNDTFATYTLLSLTTSDGNQADASKATLLISSDGGENFNEIQASVSGHELSINNLEAGTQYKIKAIIDGSNTRTIEFTTEKALQIPNGNLDSETTIESSGSNWENYAFQGWGTNNPMTCSQGSAYAYCRISGSKPTDDAYKGKAAQLRTNGWGSGNTAAGTFNSRKCKYMDAGLLHLGSSRSGRPDGFSGICGPLDTSDLDCGIAFESRPKSVSFWFKYEAKNSSDHGKATAYVLDADGNKIAEGSMELSAQDSYSERTIPFNYNKGCAKAAKIYVCFMSTELESALQKDNNWVTPPSFGNLSRDEYRGSTLFIDEVNLNY